MKYLEFLVGFLGLTGYLLISSGYWYGFGVGLIASVFGMAFFIKRDMQVMALLQVAYAAMNLHALTLPVA